MRIEEDVKLDFDDVLIRPKRSILVSRKDVDLTRSFLFKHSTLEWCGIPIVSSNMTSVTTEGLAVEMCRNKMLACLPKKHLYPRMEAGMIETVGLHDISEARSDWICLDAPNGYIEMFVERLRELRKRNSDSLIIAGNVVTPEMTEELLLAGADIVKIGLGSGAVCTTRQQTGVGYPQLSAVIECADAAHGLRGHIMSDGGCRNPGDVVKAFAAGADFVMLGGMLAGHDENGVEFYGMASKRAAEESAGGLKDYRAIEGKEVTLSPKGPVTQTLQEITGGLRSACAYVGAKTLKELPKRATFVRVQ